jgi:VCBS repeat-containing protein
LAALPSNPNQLPIAFTDSISLNEDTALQFDAVLNDRDPESDPLRAVGVFNPAGNLGFASLDVAGKLTYSAIGKFDYLAAGQSAQESFNYVVSDGRSGSDEGRVDVTITGVNDAPVARPDQISLGQNQARTFNPLTNDTDPDNGDAAWSATVFSDSALRGAGRAGSIAPIKASTREGVSGKVIPAMPLCSAAAIDGSLTRVCGVTVGGTAVGTAVGNPCNPRNASANALAMHTGVLMLLPSPKPLAPRGVKGLGVCRCTMTGSGTSQAVGIKYSAKVPDRKLPSAL